MIHYPQGLKSSSRMSACAICIVVFAVSIEIALLAWGALRQSPTWDEVNFLPAGISHWEFGTFSDLRGNPPLVRMVAATPVLFAAPKTDWRNFRDDFREMQFGRDFVTANGERSFWLFTLARWACIPFSLLGGWVCFCWARDLYGLRAGLLALVLWCFSPDIIAHGQLMTPDVAATSVGATALYLFWYWLRDPRWGRALTAGIVLGVALLTKITWIILPGLLFCIWLVFAAVPVNKVRRYLVARQYLQLGLILLTAGYVLNQGYGFDGMFQQLGRYQFVSEALGGQDAIEFEGGNRFASTFLGKIPIPLPKNYVQGLDSLFHIGIETTQPGYLFGEWRTGGWWYYYLCGLGMKIPLGMWVLVIVTIFLKYREVGQRFRWTDELMLLLPALALLVLFSSQTSLNKHLRYVLPILPLVFVWMSQVARPVSGRSKAISAVVGIAIVWSVTSSLWVYPHSLSYFNELTGGPHGGHNYILGSNVEWGQDLLYLRRWMDSHPAARPLQFEYYLPHVSPTIVGIESDRPPLGMSSRNVNDVRSERLGPRPGWYAMSVNKIHGQGGEYLYFLKLKPVDMAGYSIYIYHVSLDEANLVRRELGMTVLSSE